MVRLLLIRHAATAAAGENLLLGSTDDPASKPGMREIDRLRPLLAPYEPTAWYSSPMRRTVQTVGKLQELGAAHGKVQFDERLREVDFGRWEKKRFDEIAENDPQLIQAWSGYRNFTFPDGEKVEAFIDRVAGVLDELRNAGSGVTAVVTHGGVIRTMICLGLGLDAKNYLLFAVRPASLTVLDMYPEGGVLTGLNL